MYGRVVHVSVSAYARGEDRTRKKKEISRERSVAGLLGYYSGIRLVLIGEAKVTLSQSFHGHPTVQVTRMERGLLRRGRGGD